MALIVVLSIPAVGLTSGLSNATMDEAPEHTLQAEFSDEHAYPGDKVTVSLDLTGDEDLRVGSYNIEVHYDSEVMSFVEASGVDIDDPVVNEPTDGVLKLAADQPNGEPVPLTAATLTFEIDASATPGDSATVELVDDQSDFYDPNDHVSHVSDSGTVTVADGPTFALNSISTNAPVVEGKDLVVEAEIENIGTDPGAEWTCLWDHDGDKVDCKLIHLDPGETEKIDLRWKTEIGDAGVGDITVETESQGTTETVEVLEAPDISASIGTEKGTVGEQVTVPVDLTALASHDAEVGSYDVEITYDSNVLSFDHAHGKDLDAPVVNEIEPGKLALAADQPSGVEVPLTPVMLTFTVDDSAEKGDHGEIKFVPGESEFLDPMDEVSAAFDAGGVVVTLPTKDHKVGDSNGDTEISVRDSAVIQQHLVGMDPGQFNTEAADVNRDGDVTVRDSVLIKQYLIGMIDDGTVEVNSLAINSSFNENSVDVVERSEALPDDVNPEDTTAVVVDFENVGGLGAIQTAELRIADTEDGLDDPLSVIDLSVVDLAGEESVSVVFVVPDDDVDGDDWIGVYTEDDEATQPVS
jgi:hypothetical protein